MAEEVQDKLEQEVSNQHLAQIAEGIKRWEMIIDDLGITEAESVEIKKDNQGFYRLQKIACLRLWKQKYGYKATYQYLLQTVRKVTSEQQVASVITKLIGIKSVANSVATLYILSTCRCA